MFQGVGWGSGRFDKLQKDNLNPHSLHPPCAHPSKPPCLASPGLRSTNRSTANHIVRHPALLPVPISSMNRPADTRFEGWVVDRMLITRWCVCGGLDLCICLCWQQDADDKMLTAFFQSRKMLKTRCDQQDPPPAAGRFITDCDCSSLS